jgi:hypothetical protein
VGAVEIMKKTIEGMIQEEIDKQLKLAEIKRTHQMVTEGGLSRVLGEYFNLGFIIISSDRTCESELNKDCSEKEKFAQLEKNRRNEKQLKIDIRDAKFGFLPVYGGYKEKREDADGNKTEVDTPFPEHSFIIPMQQVASSHPYKGPSEDLKQLGISLAKKYNQECFLYKPPKSESGNTAYFISQDGEITMKFDGVTVNDLLQSFYTQLRKRGRGRFSFTETKKLVLYIPKSPNGMGEAVKRYGEIFYRLS